MEMQRRVEGRIAAQRCFEASRVAVDERTKDALARAGVRYLLKSIGIEAAPAPGVTGDAGAGLTWEAHDGARQTSARWGGLDAADWDL